MARILVGVGFLLLTIPWRAFAWPYAPRPNDEHFFYQWNFEGRDTNANFVTIDLNVRAAWPVTKGEGVTIAIVDDGVDLAHPDLIPRQNSALHFNFESQNTDGNHPKSYFQHGTAVAGLAVANGYDGTGIIGVAPHAQFASWVIYSTNQGQLFVTPDQRAQMFQYASNSVQVQNHSWAIQEYQGQMVAPTPQEATAISNATTFGRDGKGVVIVRGSNDHRNELRDVNDDAYMSDPRVITVGAVRSDGKVASYSGWGAPLLVVAPSSDTGGEGIFTTDRINQLGYNQFFYFTGDWANFVYNGVFGGTSAAAPQISGIVALILSANPSLTIRDVQQILINCSKQFDDTDTDVVRNGGGYLVSHKTGFGVPDAGWAVHLAKAWHNRPAAAHAVYSSAEVKAVSDAGLRLVITGTGIPAELTSIQVYPSRSLAQVDDPTAVVPLVDVGTATNDIAIPLAGSAALIRRGDTNFEYKIERAGAAGAAFAVIYDNGAQPAIAVMPGTDFAPIPGVFIADATVGTNLNALITTNASARAQLTLDRTIYTFDVQETLICEHVGVTIHSDHPQRGDLRITLVSAFGTRSVLQSLNPNGEPLPNNTWTYYTTHHFYESSAGTWKVEISDELPGAVGSITFASIDITGVPITDSDRDGLDDNWEMQYFGSLIRKAADDPDQDGYRTAREQVLGMNPAVDEAMLDVDLSKWNSIVGRLSWASSPSHSYEVWATTDLDKPMVLVDTVVGDFPQTQWFLPSGFAHAFYKVIRK